MRRGGGGITKSGAQKRSAAACIFAGLLRLLLEDCPDFDSVAAADLVYDGFEVAFHIGAAALADLVQTFFQSESGFLFALAAHLIVDTVSLHELHDRFPFPGSSPLFWTLAL